MHPILVGPLATAGFSAFLALVISLLDGKLNDYGTVNVTINGGKKKLPVRGGSPLLGTLAGEEIFLPSACGGRGSCGACKCVVTSDVGPYLPTETPYISAEEVSRKIRLACQIKVKKDIEIEIPESLFSIKRFEASVGRVRDLTYDIKEVRFDLRNPSSIDFMPGQYVQLAVPKYGDITESVQRAYSMSSVPGDPGNVELLVRLVPGGIATTWVHKFMKTGDVVQLIGPFGDFQVHDTPSTMVCVAGGSGMAPFKSMFNDMRARDSFPGKEIWFFFGARSTRDMFYLDELRKLEKEWPRFHFVPALSEPKPEEGWNGEIGLITNVLDSHLSAKISAGKPREGYLCGSPGMIDACIKVMTKNGIDPRDIFYDKFA
ncbi:MAG: 2Fe-2S iron-sulfur cluster binding domain-containing protein [Spirochaetes bacterium]|nr:2Fe-2S iron-sulfur cluster binding domain-containing protein [Spirochaetota bacterium]